nr:glycolipid transfer protein 1-like [Tanacetum cinerariifolium]
MSFGASDGRMAAFIRNLLELRYLAGDRITEISTQKIEGTMFALDLEGMKHVKSEDSEMLSKPFLDVCKQM